MKIVAIHLISESIYSELRTISLSVERFTLSNRSIWGKFAANIQYGLMISKYSQTQDILDTLADRTGKMLGTEPDRQAGQVSPGITDFRSLIKGYHHKNPWFTAEYIEKSLQILLTGLRSGIRRDLISRTYPNGKTIAFIINPGAAYEGAGEIIFAVICGFRCLIKLPADCISLYESLFAYFAGTYSGFSDKVEFFSQRLPSFDAIVVLNAFEGSGAVGYINKWPNLLIYRKGCTVTMAGDESATLLEKIAAGICDFYGRSFFSIKSLVVPVGYDFAALFRELGKYNNNSVNHRYFNHYEYHKSLMLINGIHHLDNGFLLLTSDLSQTGKTGVVTYVEHNPESSTEVTSQLPGFDPDIHLCLHNKRSISGQLLHEEILFFNSAKLSDFLSGL